MLKLHLLYLFVPIITYASLFSEKTKQIQSPLYASEVQMGKSVSSNSLYVYFLTKIPFKNVQELYGRNAILIDSYMHAREPYSLQLIQKLFQNIVKKSYEGEIDYFIQNGVFIFYPFVNIDGFRSIGQKGSFDEGLRKNLNTKGTQCQSGLPGVDINRNFPAKFGILKQSSFPCSQQYHGESPFSEKQAVVFKEIFDSFKVLIAIDIHSYGNEWIYPYASDQTSIRVKQNKVLYPFYEELIEEFTSKNRKIKGCKQSLGYIADGVYIDWALDQGALSLAFEVGKTFHSDKREEVQKAISQAIQDFYIVFAKTKPSYEIQKHQQAIQIKSLSLSIIEMQVTQGINNTIISLKPRSSALIPFDKSNQKIYIKNLDTEKIDQIYLKESPIKYFKILYPYLLYSVPILVLSLIVYLVTRKKSNKSHEGAIELQENTGSFSERSHQIQQQK